MTVKMVSTNIVKKGKRKPRDTSKIDLIQNEKASHEKIVNIIFLFTSIAIFLNCLFA